jgi:hypothetical protein
LSIVCHDFDFFVLASRFGEFFVYFMPMNFLNCQLLLGNFNGSFWEISKPMGHSGKFQSQWVILGNFKTTGSFCENFYYVGHSGKIKKPWVILGKLKIHGSFWEFLKNYG